MKLYRYTYDGEGIIQAMRLLDDIDMEPADERRFVREDTNISINLPTPDCCYNGSQTHSWFTEEGFHWFKYSMSVIANTFTKYVGDKIKIEEQDYIGTILYQDDFQVVIPANS